MHGEKQEEQKQIQEEVQEEVQKKGTKDLRTIEEDNEEDYWSETPSFELYQSTDQDGTEVYECIFNRRISFSSNHSGECQLGNYNGDGQSDSESSGSVPDASPGTRRWTKRYNRKPVHLSVCRSKIYNKTEPDINKYNISRVLQTDSSDGETVYIRDQYKLMGGVRSRPGIEYKCTDKYEILEDSPR